MNVTVSCPQPACRTNFPLEGFLDLGALPDTGLAYGTTNAELSVACPACATTLRFTWLVTWRPPE